VTNSRQPNPGSRLIRSGVKFGDGRLAKLLADLARARRVESIREGVREADGTDESLPETEIVA